MARSWHSRLPGRSRPRSDGRLDTEQCSMSSSGSNLAPILGTFARSAAAFILLAASPARAEVRYEVEPNGDRTRIKVTMRFEAGPGPLELQMPNWSPGDYELK